MTKEELIKTMRETQNKQQEEFMAKILDSIELLNDKANRKDYEPTIDEKTMFSKIATLVKNMEKWF